MSGNSNVPSPKPTPFEVRPEADYLIDATRKAMLPIAIQYPTDAIFVPNAKNGQGEILDMERYFGKPRRKSGKVQVFDIASLNRAIAENLDAGDESIYVDADAAAPQIVAVLNGNGAQGPGWGDFRAEIKFRPTPQWRKWREINGKMLSQEDFAEFIEENLADVVDPNGAEMYEISQYLTMTKTTNFKSGIRLQDGRIQFQNVEDVAAKVGQSEIVVPEQIKLQLSPFVGCSAYRVPAFFRYRLRDGKLLMGIKMQRVEDLMQQVIDEMVAQIVTNEKIVMFQGIAPLPRAE